MNVERKKYVVVFVLLSCDDADVGVHVTDALDDDDVVVDVGADVRGGSDLILPQQMVFALVEIQWLQRPMPLLLLVNVD